MIAAPLVKEAESVDVPRIAKLFNLYRIFYGQPDNEPCAQQFLLERIHNNQSIIVYAENVLGECMGFVQLYPSFSSVAAQPIWILNDLFVEKSYRQQGIATHLLNHVIALAPKKQVASIRLETAHDNESAQKLYKKFGFQLDTYFLTFRRVL